MNTNSNVHFCFYNSSGEILMYGSCPVSQLAYQSFEGCKLKNLGRDFLPPDKPHYVSTSGAIVPCKSFTIETIPLPCTITIEGIEYEVTTKPTFEFDAPGTYQIYVDAGVQFTREMFNVTQA